MKENAKFLVCGDATTRKSVRADNVDELELGAVTDIVTSVHRLPQCPVLLLVSNTKSAQAPRTEGHDTAAVGTGAIAGGRIVIDTGEENGHDEQLAALTGHAACTLSAIKKSPSPGTGKLSPTTRAEKPFLVGSNWQIARELFLKRNIDEHGNGTLHPCTNESNTISNAVPLSEN